MDCEYPNCLYTEICRLKKIAEKCGLYRMNKELERRRTGIKFNGEPFKIGMAYGRRKTKTTV